MPENLHTEDFQPHEVTAEELEKALQHAKYGPPEPERVATAVRFTDEQLATDPILAYFAYDHLPEHLRAISGIFASVALTTVTIVPRSAERTVSLRKLLEAKNAAVRAALPTG